MKIGPLSHHQPVDPAQVTPPMTKQQDDEHKELAKADRVEISENGRELLADMADRLRREQPNMDGGEAEADTMTVERSSGLSGGKLEQIRLKILSGFYTSPQVIDTIADRLSDDIDA